MTLVALPISTGMIERSEWGRKRQIKPMGPIQCSPWQHTFQYLARTPMTGSARKRRSRAGQFESPP